jgi:site-specific recombinase
LQEDKSLLFALRRVLLSRFLNSNLNQALTESGIVSSRGFVQELVAKIKHKLLPPMQLPGDFLYVIGRVFYRKSDYAWVGGIDRGLWKRFFDLLGIQVNLSDAPITRQLTQSLQILSYRMATLGMEKEVISRYVDFRDAIQPFIEQNRLVNLYVERNVDFTEEEKRVLLGNIKENLYNCHQGTQWIREQRVLHGTSLAQTFVIVRLEQQIERMLVIIDALDRDNFFNTDRFVDYFVTMVKNENRKNSLSEFLSDTLGMLAYQIAEHKGKKGEKYISSSRKDFQALFRGSMVGGAIISFVTCAKTLLTSLHLPLFWEGAAYGANYAAGFVVIDEMGATLATKQPAYTASALARSLDERKQEGRPDLSNLVIAVARVSRSQIASFAGNLLLVFPFTWLLAFLLHLITGSKLVEGEAATRMLEDQHPWHSLSLLYACFTGFFLFLSGLIAGYVENHVVYGRMAERLQTHPVFTHTIPAKRLASLSRWIGKHSGTLAGSISLGFFLGCAHPLGEFLGIHFDVRHITISSGNVALAFFGLDNHVAPMYLLTVILGVLMIGFLNFLVSFSLAFFVAVKSRGIRLRDYPEFLSLLGRYFIRHPRRFVWPPKGEETMRS